MTKRILMLTSAVCAISAGGSMAYAATATDTASASSNTSGAAVVTDITVVAEKREANIQTVPIAITAFTAKKRDDIGINSIQDMTNFTPGLTYSTSTDRITLRGVGRTTNVLSADAPVANYDDGLYETFAVAAGRSSLELADVDIQRGPQGTLGGRNALAGALNEITQHPTSTPHFEARLTYGNYNHITAEAEAKGPINDVWQYRLYVNWDKQTQGWIKNVVPGRADEGGIINEWYADFQIQAHFNDHFEMWTKFQSAQWFNGSGGPGAQSAGWTRAGFPNYEFSVAGTRANAGYACIGLASHVVNPSPFGCFNPQQNTPWVEADNLPRQVELPSYYSLNSQWTWHASGFDIKYIGGGTYYKYELYGRTGGDNAPITSYQLPCSFVPGCGPAAAGSGGGGLVINPTDSFEYREKNGFFSNELNFISTGHGPVQWVAGVYQFYQSYQQPVSAADFQQPQDGGPLFQGTCANTGGVCVTPLLNRWFDNRPAVKDQSYAIYGQIDWKATDTLKLTLGIRYSWDRKYGTESVRLTCFALPACFTQPELNFFIPGGIPAVDLTQIPTVVDNGPPPPGVLPTGVTGVTTYSATTGLATRHYNANWSSPSGTAGIEWQPDSNSLYYFKYGRGYKSGGYNIGIFTVLSFSPWTAAEHVNSFEIGAKHTFGHFLTANFAAFYYDYSDLQIPIAQIQTAGGLSQSETSFYNVPKSVSRGIEIETTWTPIENLAITFNYSWLDSYITKGTAADPADPNAIAPNAKPLFTPAQCLATLSSAHPDCTVDVYTLTATQAAANAAAGGAAVSASTLYATPIPGNPNQGWNIPQNLSGNRLPNAPKNKIAINVLYDWHLSNGAQLIPSVSYTWRDKEYGLFFNEDYYAAPAWGQWDARLSFTSPSGKFTAILFIKNIAGTIGYDQGALATRAAGTTDVPGPGGSFLTANYVQGLNGPTYFNNHIPGANALGVFSTYYVTPPRTVGVELHYKFY